MSLGARPLGPRDVRAIFDRKVADFRRASRDVQLRHLELERYLDAVRDDPDIRFAVETGFISDLEAELRDPVVAFPSGRELVTCPDLVLRVLADEPAEIHRAFVEGVLFRKLFRFFVPAAHEGGESWEMSEQVREIMRKHFAFQLVVTETILGRAA